MFHVTLLPPLCPTTVIRKWKYKSHVCGNSCVHFAYSHNDAVVIFWNLATTVTFLHPTQCRRNGQRHNLRHMEIVTVKSTAKAGVPVNAGYTDRTLQEEKHTQPARILDSYQRELEIRKLKSLFPLLDSTCFLSKQAACSSRACRSPFIK